MKNRLLPIAMSAALAMTSTAAVYTPVMMTTITAVAATEILEGKIVLDKDTVYTGNYELINGYIDLNGHNLTIEGNFYQGGFQSDKKSDIFVKEGSVFTVTGDYEHMNGTLDVDGSLKIEGDYRQNHPGRGELTTGMLVMNNEGCSVDVDGSVVFHSKADIVTGQNNGVLSIGGDLTVAGEHSFQPYSNHVTNFKGDKDHTITFESRKFNNMNIVKATGKGSILLSGETSGFTLGSDLTLAGDSVLRGNRKLDLNSHNLTVNGNFNQGEFFDEDESPDIVISQESTMTVKGDYRHLDGSLDVDGTLKINGSYHQDASGRGELGTGELLMNNENCSVDVDGDVVFHSSADIVTGQNNGVLSIGGDLTVAGEHSFQPYSLHITEFRGIKEHKIKFASAKYNYLNNIRIGVGDSLKFTGALSGVDAKGAVITVDPENIAVIEELTVQGAEEGKGKITFANEKNSVTKEFTVVKTGAVIEKPIKGDTNGDGIINAVDASKILVMYTEISAGGEITDAVVFEICDVNMDGKINAVDASLVLAYYANLAVDPTLTLDDFLISVGVEVDDGTEKKDK